MAGNAKSAGEGRAGFWRVAAWSAAALILALPLLAMQVSDEVNWTAGDFIVAGLMIGIVGLAYELTVRVTGDWTRRAATASALAAAFLLVWANGAVGIVGSENNPFNQLYFLVPPLAVAGAFLARFRAAGMARATGAAAAAMGAIAVIALATGEHHSAASSAGEIIGATAVLGAPWLLSALLFRKAAKTDGGAA